MSDPTKRKPDANATIQIDLDQVQLFDPDASAGGAARKVPPPLPATAPDAAGSPGALAVGPAQNPARTIAIVAMFVMLIAAAIAGGLLVGTRARGTGDAPSAAAPAATAPSPAPGTSAAQPATSAGTLTVPTIEMR